MSRFCAAKATHIFFSKKFQHICVSLDVNFNKSLSNDVVSFEQLGPDKGLSYLLTEPLNTTECMNGEQRPGPSCSKLTMSLVNDSLKFTFKDMQICRNFLLKKCE